MSDYMYLQRVSYDDTIESLPVHVSVQHLGHRSKKGKKKQALSVLSEKPLLPIALN